MQAPTQNLHLFVLLARRESIEVVRLSHLVSEDVVQRGHAWCERTLVQPACKRRSVLGRGGRL